MNSKHLVIATFAVIFTMSLSIQPIFAQQATGTASILERTCGLDFYDDEGSTPRSIDFGTLLDGTTWIDPNPSITNIEITNTGNSPGVAYIQATNWVNGTGFKVMNANQTYYDPAGFDTASPYTASARLSTDSTEIFGPGVEIDEGTQFGLHFGLIVNLDDPLFTGAMTQTWIYTAEC